MRPASLGDGDGCGALALGPRGAQRLGDPEIGDHRRAAREQDVLRLDVAVHDPLGVGVGQRPRDIAQDADRLGHGETYARGKPRPEGLAAHERHRVVGQASRLAGGENRDDVRLLQPCGELYLAREALGAQALRQPGSDHLDHHLAAERGLVGDKHPRHPPTAELAFEGVGRPEGALELVAEVGHRQGRPDVGEPGLAG